MTPKSRDHVGLRMLATRLQRGLSQDAVARRAGLDPSYLCRIEGGKVNPTVRTVVRVAEGLRVSPNELLRPSPADEKAKPGQPRFC